MIVEVLGAFKMVGHVDVRGLRIEESYLCLTLFIKPHEEG